MITISLYRQGLIAAISILALWLAPVSGVRQGALAAKNVGVTLAPQNEQQKQACDLLIKGAHLLKENKPFAARPILERAATLWPGSPHIHFNLGNCYMNVGNFPKAMTEYETSLQLDPHLTDAFANIASCYQLMGQPRQAIVWFQNYLKKYPQAPDAAAVRGMIAALARQSAKQITANPQDADYLSSISSEGLLQRWQSNKLPLKVFISDGRDQAGIPVPGFRDYYNEILLESFNTWMKACDGRLCYVLTDDAQNADIVCTWTNRKDFLQARSTSVEQGVARVISRPLSNNREEEIAHVNIIILITNIEGQSNITDDVMRKACLHETGHALGIAGHSTNNKDVMFFSDSPTVWDSLTRRDKSTMARLYQDYPRLQATAAPVYLAPASAFEVPTGPSSYEQNILPGAASNNSNNSFENSLNRNYLPSAQ